MPQSSYTLTRTLSYGTQISLYEAKAGNRTVIIKRIQMNPETARERGTEVELLRKRIPGCLYSIEEFATKSPLTSSPTLNIVLPNFSCSLQDMSEEVDPWDIAEQLVAALDSMAKVGVFTHGRISADHVLVDLTTRRLVLTGLCTAKPADDTPGEDQPFVTDYPDLATLLLSVAKKPSARLQKVVQALTQTECRRRPTTGQLLRMVRRLRKEEGSTGKLK